MKKIYEDFDEDFDDDFEDELENDEFDYPENYVQTKDEDDEFQSRMRMKNISKKFKPDLAGAYGNWKDEKPYSPLKSHDLPLDKYLQKSKTTKLKESDLKRIVKKVLSEQKTQNYMFFSNLEQIKRQCELLLELDPSEIENILQNGHDWADDHVTVAKENMDQVFDFMMNQTQGNDDNDMVMEEGRKKTGTKLCARGKAAAKSKFKVYPSAYANGYAVQVCKGKMPGSDGKKHCSAPYC